MESKSIVYWAPPHEVPSLRNTVSDLLLNNLVKTRMMCEKILDHINPGDKVGVKLHVGESHNTRYLRHDYVREVINAIKSKGGIPTLIETQGLGMSHRQRDISDDYRIYIQCRRNKDDHMKIVRLHGFGEDLVGAPFRFIDGENGIDGKMVDIDGIKLKKVPVASGLFDYDKLVILSRFKGHPQAGMGGAMKNLGIGCVNKHGKALAHFSKSYKINPRRCDPSKCNQECIKACPVNVIKIESERAHVEPSLCIGCGGCIEVCPIKKAVKSPLFDENDVFSEKFIDNTLGVLAGYGRENIRYINIAIEVTLICDCAVSVNMPVCPDLGIFGSDDPLAIDKACFDAEIDAPGLSFLDPKGNWTEPVARGIEKFHNLNPVVDPTMQIDAAIKNKIGNINYELIKI
jgi:uncharacterized Fe-S center protein